jgi:hydroxymethylpyrimidine/phosphomethylpyrimidine kinase
MMSRAGSGFRLRDSGFKRDISVDSLRTGCYPSTEAFEKRPLLHVLIMKYVMTIAGSDSCGGAGIQADIKTISGLGAHPLTVITALTAQNSLGIDAVHEIPTTFISQQIETTVGDVFPDAVKIGMLSSGEAIRAVAKMVKRFELPRVVVDPVLNASTGKNLLAPEAVSLLKEILLPLSRVVTPNLDEVEVLTGRRVRNLQEMEEAAKHIKDLGPDVVVTGGHLKGECVDLLFNGKTVYHFTGAKIDTEHVHGTGCVFSSALATFLALEENVVKATEQAHEFTKKAIERGYPCGKGAGAVRP